MTGVASLYVLSPWYTVYRINKLCFLFTVTEILDVIHCFRDSDVITQLSRYCVADVMKPAVTKSLLSSSPPSPPPIHIFSARVKQCKHQPQNVLTQCHSQTYERCYLIQYIKHNLLLFKMALFRRYCMKQGRFSVQYCTILHGKTQQ